jgi:methylated-DNA-protein-cysteine methyltransferase-like protein
MPGVKFRRALGSPDMDRIARMHRIWETICEIPRGSVANYGQIAEIAGVPRGARQVGYALRHLPEGHEVPWHRVLQSSGKIAFEKGSSSYKEQGKRLMMEDVAVVAGKVDMNKYRWQPDLDELLWKPTSAWDEE